MANNLGVSAKSPTRYVGPDTNLIPIIKVKRLPLPADDKFPLAQFWLVGDDPTTGDEGDLYYLERIDGPNLAVWSKIESTVGGVVADIRDQLDTQVTTDGSGYIDIDGLVVANGANPSSIPFQTVADPGTHTLKAQMQVAAAVAASPGDKNDAGICSFDEDAFSVDVDGNVQIKGVSIWEYVSDASKTAEPNKGYVCDNAAGVEVTLPTTAEFGSVLSLTAESGTWKLAQGAGQSVVFGDHQTTVGVAGYLESTEIGDSITLVCTEADTTWQAVDGAIGNISIDGTAFNNALDEYSNRFEVGADAKGTATGTILMEAREDRNTGSGIYAVNESDDTDAYAYHAVICGSTGGGARTGGYIASTSLNYTTSPNPIGKTGYFAVVSSDESNGIQNRIGNIAADFIWDYQTTNLMNLDTDAVLTVNKAVKAGDDVDSEDVEFTVSDLTTGINAIQCRDDRNSLTRIVCKNEYENGITSGSRVAVQTGVAGESSRVSGGIGAHSPNYTTVPSFEGRISLFSDITGGDGLNLGFATNQSLTMSAVNASQTFFKMTGDGERTMPLNPSFSAFSAGETNVTGDGTNITVKFPTEVEDRGSNYDNTTNIFTSPVEGAYLFPVNITLTGLTSGMVDGQIELVTSNRTYRLYRGSPYSFSNNSGTFAYSAIIKADMDASDTAYVRMYVAGGTKVVDINDLSNFNGYLLG